MMLRTLFSCISLVGTAWAAAVSGGELPSAPTQVIVLNAGYPEPGSVAFVDPASWKVKTLVPVGINPAEAVLARDESLLYVFCSGEEKQVPVDTTTQGSLHVLDVSTQQRVAVWSLGDRFGDVHFRRADSALVCVAYGRDGDGAVVSIVSLAANRVVGQLSLRAECVGSVSSADGSCLALVLASSKTGSRFPNYDMASLTGLRWRSGRRREPSLPARVVFLDTRTLALTGEVALSQIPVSLLACPTGRYAYLLTSCPAPAFRFPDKPDELLVLDLDGHALVRSLPIGWSARAACVGPGASRIYAVGRVTAHGTPTTVHSLFTLFAVEDSSIVFSVGLKDVGCLPVCGEKGGALAMLQSDGIGVLSRTDGRTLFDIKTKVRGEDKVLTVNADASRAYVLDPAGGHMSVVDLVHGCETTSLGMGRTGAKLMTFALETLGTAAVGVGNTWQASRGIPMTYAERGWSTAIFPMPPRETGSMLFGRDERFLYVLSRATRDVTVVDAARDSVVARIPTGEGSSRMFGLMDVDRLLVMAESHVMLIDASQNAALDKVKSHTNLRFVEKRDFLGYDASGRRAFLGVKDGLQVVELNQGAEEAFIKGLDRPIRVFTTGNAGTASLPR